MSQDLQDDALAREHLAIVREVRQRLESLRRAGVDRMPRPAVLPALKPKAVATPRLAAPTVAAAVAAPTPVAPEIRPEPPKVAAEVRPATPQPTEPPAPRPAVRVTSLFDEVPIEAPAVDPAERPAALAVIQQEVAGCVKCAHLAASRTKTVFGVGTPTARLMFIGEAPGADEDRQGEPFVGRAGQLLTDMITKGMGLTREQVYIANILKCRPPENRNPEPPEIANCIGYLERQIEIVRPEFLCLLGKIAASTLLDTALPLARLRSKWQRYKGIPTIVTYHPAYLLRNPADKKKAWEDLQMLMQAMGITPPSKKKG